MLILTKSVARMVPVKNHINLIRAFSELLKHTKRKVELVLIGTGDLEQKVKSEVFSLGLSNKVKFLGELSSEKVFSHLVNADSFIMISKVHIVKDIVRQEEAMGLSILEAAKFGLPLIGSTTGGIPEIVKNEINGYLVDPLDIQQIIGAMLKIIENPLKSIQMGKKAKELLEKNFCMEVQMKKLEEIFLNVIKENHNN